MCLKSVLIMVTFRAVIMNNLISLFSVTLYLDGPVLSNQLVLHFVAPQSSFCEVLQQVRIHNLWERQKTHSATFPSMDT